MHIKFFAYLSNLLNTYKTVNVKKYFVIPVYQL